MKRYLPFFLALLLFAVLSLPASAAEPSPNGENETGADPDPWSDFLAGLPDGVRDRLPESGDAGTLSELVGVKSLFALLYEGVSDGWLFVLPGFLSLLSLVLLSACYELFARGGTGGRTPVSAALSVVVSLAVFRVAEGTVSGVVDALSSLSSVMTGFLPVRVSLSLSDGGVASAAAAGTGIAAILSLVALFFCRVLPTVSGCCFGLSLVGTLGGDDLKLDGISSNLRGVFLFSAGILSTILTGSLALQTGLSAASDGVALKTAKTALSGMIPIVGGTVSGTLSTVSGSLSLLRRSVGVGAVYALLLLVLPTLIRLLLFRFSYSLSAAVARIFSLSSTERLLGEFRAVSDLLLASLSMGAAVFFISVGVLVRCAPAAG
ncbi:MAG: hypothetical protein J6P88_04510 [Clostridia bacterium]|nr:hypothetical protein [Clostridia bacterium]